MTRTSRTEDGRGPEMSTPSATAGQWYVWVVCCGEDHGWGAVGLWGDKPRVYRTRSEACAHREALVHAGCWETETDDGDVIEEIPEFYIQRLPVLVAVGDPDIADEVRALMPPPGTPVPARVLRDTAAVYSGRAQGWARASSSLRGASSATHTAAFAAGQCEALAAEYLEMIGQRPVLSAREE